MEYSVHIEQKQKHKTGNKTYFTKLQSVIPVTALDKTHCKAKIYASYGFCVKILNIIENEKLRAK